ncbi:hypothetical protein ACOTTU_15990 [Roseobacter sp. EG26]|uniref:hypothetical protein n=1 Tax=Roseobacter sp. EG26 TaxID=3412477 RepID=UPI003CE4771A
MLIFLEKRLTFLATPKTGTTAVELALKPRAEIAFSKGRKHINAMRYWTKIAPFLADTFDARPRTVAVMREPVEQLRSWYRYRSRHEEAAHPKSTKNISFDTFVLEVIAKAPREFALVGSQFAFLSDPSGRLLVQHLFAYERQAAFREFLSTQLDMPIELKQKNVSPPVNAPLSEAVYQRLRQARAAEFALYNRILTADGYLESDPPTGF